MANANPLSSMVLARALLNTHGDASVDTHRDTRPRPRRRLHLRRRTRRVEVKVWLAEHYVESVDATRLDALARDLASAGVLGRGKDVLLLGVLGLPSDESLISLFAASGADAVAGTLERAGIPADRIEPVLWRGGRRNKIG